MQSISKFVAIIVTVIALFSIGSLPSCKKDIQTTVIDTGKVYLEFFNVVGGSNLKLNNQWYKNQNGDSFKVTKLNYYISNIVLTGSDGSTVYKEPNSYHLIEHSATPSQMTFYLDKVPGKKYASISFMIGVDSLRNVSGAQDGDLDPVKGNFWSWNTGYIMFKFEGNSPQAPTADGRLVFHTGGFSGPNNVLKTVSLSFPKEIEVAKNGSPHVHLQADVLALFKSPNMIDFATTTAIHMPGSDAKKFADNYANMFSITYAGL